MPKNIILFYHYHETEVGDLLKKALQLFKKNGFDTLCIEGNTEEYLSKKIISSAITSKEQLKNQIEKKFNIQIDDISKGQTDLAKLILFLNIVGHSSREIVEIIELSGDINLLHTLQNALSAGFKIKGIDFKVNDLNRHEIVDQKIWSMRQEKQFNTLKKLNDQGRNCIVLLEASQFANVRKKIAELPLRQHANFQLVYLHSNILLIEEFKNEIWFPLRTKPLPLEFRINIPIRSYEISNPKEQERFLKEIAGMKPTPWLMYGMMAVAGISLYAYSKFAAADIVEQPLNQTGYSP